MRNIIRISALTTWVSLLLGFVLSPAFFLVGIAAFMVALLLWTVLAIQDEEYIKAALVWGVGVAMIVLLGFAFVWLPSLKSDPVYEIRRVS